MVAVVETHGHAHGVADGGHRERVRDRRFIGVRECVAHRRILLVSPGPVAAGLERRGSPSLEGQAQRVVGVLAGDGVGLGAV